MLSAKLLCGQAFPEDSSEVARLVMRRKAMRQGRGLSLNPCSYNQAPPFDLGLLQCFLWFSRVFFSCSGKGDYGMRRSSSILGGNLCYPHPDRRLKNTYSQGEHSFPLKKQKTFP